MKLARPGVWAEVPAERAGELLEGLAERIVAGKPGLPPPRLCPLAEIEAAQRLARSGRHLGGIALTLDEVGFRADASYLITGGLGALGLEAAEWLAERGAGHLVLVGRSEAGAEVRERLVGLEERRAAGWSRHRQTWRMQASWRGCWRDSLESARRVRSGRGWRE